MRMIENGLIDFDFMLVSDFSKEFSELQIPGIKQTGKLLFKS